MCGKYTIVSLFVCVCVFVPSVTDFSSAKISVFLGNIPHFLCLIYGDLQEEALFSSYDNICSPIIWFL